jgi:hypothetical protein
MKSDASRLEHSKPGPLLISPQRSYLRCRTRSGGFGKLYPFGVFVL